MGIISWIKRNKLATLLLLVIVYLIWKNNYGGIPIPLTTSLLNYGNDMALKSSGSRMMGSPGAGIGIVPPSDSYAPQPEVANRMVIQNSYLSLLVKEVRITVDQIISYAQSNGGYMVSSSLDTPNDTPTGSVTIRVPTKVLEATLSYLRGLSVKVVSENLSGEDVTDQYVDLDAQLATLNKTKTKFEQILDQAVKVEDILQVQRELVSLQSQIDNIKGQQQYLTKSAESVRITIYLSPDELALPYTPTETWRPEVIFKQAVRELIRNLRNAGSLLIYVGVYAVIWVPALIIILIIRNKFKKK